MADTEESIEAPLHEVHERRAQFEGDLKRFQEYVENRGREPGASTPRSIATKSR